jgi:hypothetical protein
MFARKSRQVLGLDEEQMVEPAEALRLMRSDSGLSVVFVDDFAGSGDQFLQTWRRQRVVDGRSTAFRNLRARANRFFYCPAVATWYAIDRIERACPNVTVCPGQVIPSNYNLLSTDSVLWPPDLLPTASDFVERASNANGIVAECDVPWSGYDDLGLGLAFAHSVPDATLPLFYWERNGWTPLIKRS